MIIGTGIDIVELQRMKQIVQNRKDSFANRILTDAEKELLSKKEGHRQVEFIAGRFSAKEALSKAIGTGIGKALSWRDMSIIHGEDGKPFVILSSPASALLPPNAKIHISISHSREYCISHAIIESKI